MYCLQLTEIVLLTVVDRFYSMWHTVLELKVAGLVWAHD